MIKIYNYGEVANEEIFARDNIDSNVAGIVSDIIANVIRNGDKAIYEYALKFDKAELSCLEVSEAEIEEAFSLVDKDFVAVMEEAAVNIRAFHEKQVRNSFIINDRPGIVMGQKVIPMDCVGIYVPGGTAPLFSTVLMLAIPATVAGCKQIILCTPTNKQGKVAPAVLLEFVVKGGVAAAVAFEPVVEVEEDGLHAPQPDDQVPGHEVKIVHAAQLHRHGISQEVRIIIHRLLVLLRIQGEFRYPESFHRFFGFQNIKYSLLPSTYIICITSP